MAMCSWVNGGTGQAYQQASIISNTPYVLNIWALRDSGTLTGNFYLKLIWYQGTSLIREDDENLNLGSDAWAEQTFTVISPSGADTVEVVFGSSNVNLTGKFDDVELLQANNLLQNYSFEDNTGSGGTAADWTKYGCATTESWANHSGGWGLAMCSWINSGNGAEYQEVSVSPNTPYIFNIWALRDSGTLTGSYYIKLYWCQDTLMLSEDDKLIDIPSNAWAKQTIAAISPPNANKARVAIVSSNANLTAKFDDAELIQANTFYVRLDGNDSNPGTENSSSGAWATIQKAADTANPSDLVLVEPGTYNEQVIITRSGLADQLLTFRADGAVIIDGQSTRAYGIKLDGASYIKIEGFTIRNAGSIGIFLVNNSNHNVLLNNTCYSNGSSATGTLGDRPCGIYLYTSSNYNIIGGNTCRNNTSTGIWLEGNSSYCTLKNNKSYSNGYGGMVVAGGTDYNTVSYNIIYSNVTLGLDLSYGAHDNIFNNNIFYNNGGNGVQSNNYGGLNYFKNNIIANNGLNSSWGYGIIMDPGSSAALSYNDVYNNGQGGIKNYSGVSAGPGDIVLDPLFKSTDPESSDFLKLQSLANNDANESPCIDAGSPSDMPLSGESGHRIDIGAYDLYQHAPIQGGLAGEYFSDMTLTSLKVSRIDLRINFDWGSGSPDASVGPTNFSARWTGQVKIDFAQDYTFYVTTDDGSRLWIDNQLIIDRWFGQSQTEYSATISLMPGLHDIKYEYYQDTGSAVAKLSWSTPSTNKSIIPSDHLYHFDRLPQGQYVQGGLKGIYSKYTNIYGPSSYILTRIDPQINFDWSSNMPDAALGNTLYSAKWKGKVRIDTADTYTFYATTDDGARLWVNGQVLIDAWQDGTATERQGSISLAPGLYDIELDYYQNVGATSCKLLWSSSAIAKSVIPAVNLYYKNDDSSTEGLLAEYYGNQNLTNLKIRKIDPNIDFDWLSFYPDNSIEGSTYSIRWTGQILADYNETYTFYANSDDGLKLWVDNSLLIDTWYDHGVSESSSTVNLTAGWHDIKVEYYNGSGLATAKLSYSSASAPKTAIPQDHLRTTLSAEDASLNLHCSLDSAQAVQTPVTIGHSGSIIQTGTGVVNFVPAKFADGVYLSGSDTGNEGLVQFSSADLNKKEGEIEFWFKPAWNSDDGVWHHLFSTNWTWDSCIEIFKHSDNALYFKITKNGVQHGIVSATSRLWNANTWHHLAASYGPAGMKFYLDYQQLPVSWTFNDEPAYTGTLPDTFNSDIFIGGGGEGGVPSDAIFDELKIYNQQIVPSDTTAPVIAIASHQDNQTVNSSPVTIFGTIDDNLASVTINTIQAAVSEGTFSASVPLSLGSNTITVSATDQSSNQSTQTVHLIYVDITPPSAPTANTPVSPTNINTQTISGTKEANSSIWINGSEAVPVDGLTTWSKSVSLSEGANNLAVTSKDASGNESQPPVNVSIVLDTTAPTGTIKINNDAQYTNSANVTLNLSATDTTGTGVSQMRFSNDNSGWSDPETYTTSKSWTLVSGDGSKTVYVKFKDVADNWSEAVSDSIILDTTVPTQPTIDSVTSPTNTNSQTITGTKSEDVTSVIIICSTATVGTVTYPTSTSWSCQLANLTEGDNSISVKAEDAAGNQSTAVSGGIFLDTTPPSQPSINTVTSPTNVNSQTITGTKSTDATSIIVTCSTATIGTVTYPTSTTWSCLLSSLTEGENNISVKAEDAAGNQSDPATTSILLDAAAPSGTVTINSGAQYTNSDAVTLTLSATDSGSGLSQMQFSNNSTNWSTPETYAISKSWTLTTGEGAKTVYAKFKDVAGNWSAAVSDTIIIDTTSPVIAITSPENNSVSTVSPITVSGTINDNMATVVIKVNNVVQATPVPANGAYSASVPLTQGTNTIVAIATDPATNSSNSNSITVTYQPEVVLSIAITSPANNVLVNTPTITISGTVSDNTATVTIGDIQADVTDNTFTASNIPLTEGTNIITAWAVKDTLSVQASLNVILDTISPSINIYTPDDNSTTRSNIVYGRISDDTQTVIVNGTAIEPLADFRFIVRPTLSEGANTITVQATDQAGNTNQKQINITYNTQAPKVTITSPVDNSEQDTSPINIQGTNTTDLSLIAVNSATALIDSTNFTAEGVILDTIKTVVTASGYDANDNQFCDSIVVNSSSLANYKLFKVSGDVTQGDPNCPNAGSNQALKVRLDKNNQHASNEEIQFSITQGNGSLSSASSFTDVNGETTITLTTDTNSEITNLVESHPVSNPLIKTIFSVSTKPAQPSVLTKITDDSIAPVPGVTIPLILKLTDSNNNPIQNETINFQVVQGAGTISSSTAVTTPYGEAKVNLTCPNLGLALTQVQASSQTVSSVTATFNITTSALLAVTVDDVIAKVNLNDSLIQDIKADIAVTSNAPFLPSTMQLKIWQKGDKQKVQELSPISRTRIRPTLETSTENAEMQREIISYNPATNICTIRMKLAGQTEEYPYYIIYVDYDKGVELRSEYYTINGQDYMVFATEAQNLIQINGAWVFEKLLEITYGSQSLNELYLTTNNYSNIQINTGIPDSEFNQ